LANYDTPDRNPETTPPEEAAAEANPTLREWLQRNGPTLVITLVLFGFLYFYFQLTPQHLWTIAKVVLGLGLVIFIHELGHFAVAKWCDVHVETFSIGFGPALPGCKFQYGETTYMVALFPLGGYVKMVGEGSDSDESDDDPRSFKNKPVWQRMAIISAGVTMNVILAVVCFIAVFTGPGKDQNPSLVGQVEVGSPAWVNGLPAGTWIRQIGSTEDPYFKDLLFTVMNSTGPVELGYRLPPDYRQEYHKEIQPRLGKGDPKPVIGVSPAERLALPPARYLRGREHPVLCSSPAATASPPFQFEDVIIGCTDPDHRKKDRKDDWTELPPDPRFLPRDRRNAPEQAADQKDFFAFERRLRLLAGQPMTVRVRHKDGKEESILVDPAYHYTLGLRMQMGEVTAVRLGSPAQSAERVDPPSEKKELQKGDIIEQVEVTGPDGKTPTRFVFPRLGDPPPKGAGVRLIDPARLPFELRRWAAGMEGRPKDVVLKVRRHNSTRPGDEFLPVTLTLRWDDSDLWKFDREIPFALKDPMAIPELGVAYKILTTVNGIDEGWEGKHPLQKGDVIKEVRFWRVKNGEVQEDSWNELELDQWAHAFWILQDAVEIKKIAVKVERTDEEIVLEAREDRTWPQAQRGLMLSPDLRVQRADSIGEAVLMGLYDTQDIIVRIYQNLSGMLSGRISPKNLGGPITIADTAYRIAGDNFWEFLFFLGMISINLAVINFLPIPVLDGGHMVFLLYEKIRGKPASEQVRSGATIVGLLLLASLMIFVIFLDIERIFKR
jgi:regulator of sigma E protease